MCGPAIHWATSSNIGSRAAPANVSHGGVLHQPQLINQALLRREHVDKLAQGGLSQQRSAQNRDVQCLRKRSLSWKHVLAKSEEVCSFVSVHKTKDGSLIITSCTHLVKVKLLQETFSKSGLLSESKGVWNVFFWDLPVGEVCRVISICQG